jgi:hypothetical protein
LHTTPRTALVLVHHHTKNIQPNSGDQLKLKIKLRRRRTSSPSQEEKDK